jgi:predicted nucleic acid-binding protein
VFLEIGNALARGFKREAVEIIEQFLAAEEKAWGLVDCISFIVMREAGVSQALTFDQHFVQAGFQALMREPPRT